MEPTQTSPPVARLWLAILSGYLAFGATLQALPGWVHTQFGGGSATSGIAVGIAFAATAICRPFAGRAGDAGRARIVVLGGGILITVGAVGQLLAPHLVVLLTARLVMGAGEAALFSGALPWVLSSSDASRRGRAAGWFGLSMWSGLAAGPLVAVGAASTGGPRTAWIAVIVLGALSTCLAATTPAQRPPVAPARIRPERWRDVVPRGAGLPGLGFGLAAYGYGTISAVLVLYLADRGLGGSNIGLAVFAAAFLAARWAGSPAVDRFDGAPVAVTVLTIEAAGFVLLATVPTLAGALGGAALAGVGVSLMFPATVALTLHRNPNAGPGTSVGATTSFWDLGILVASPVSGFIAGHTGYPAAFVLAAAAATTAAGLAVALGRPATPAAGDDNSNQAHSAKTTLPTSRRART